MKTNLKAVNCSVDSWENQVLAEVQNIVHPQPIVAQPSAVLHEDEATEEGDPAVRDPLLLLSAL